MKIAMIADLHGNWPAVEALEKDLNRRAVDRIYCLGDLVGKGPSSDKTMDWALKNCQFILRGNWDDGVGRKLFPADQVSRGYVKAVSAPISDAKLLAVGGVSAENARDFIEMGFYGIGVGSNLYNKKLLASGDYAAITSLAKQCTDAVK